jgi:hypothetical protein
MDLSQPVSGGANPLREGGRARGRAHGPPDDSLNLGSQLLFQFRPGSGVARAHASRQKSQFVIEARH